MRFASALVIFAHADDADPHAVGIRSARPFTHRLSLDREGFALTRDRTRVRNFDDPAELNNRIDDPASAGMRMTAATHVPELTMSHWLLAEWLLTPGWSLQGSVGTSAQGATLRQVNSLPASGPLRPERARHADLAIEQRVTSTLRWQITVFQRDERDILRSPDEHPRVVDDGLVGPERRYLNALTGSGRGIELLVDRRAPTGLSGWAAYSYGRMRYNQHYFTSLCTV